MGNTDTKIQYRKAVIQLTTMNQVFKVKKKFQIFFKKLDYFLVY